MDPTTATTGVVLPRYFFILRIAQLVFAVLVLILCAYAATAVKWSYMSSVYGVNIFTCLLTYFYLAYAIFCVKIIPGLYNMWIEVGISAFTVLMWLSSWASMASHSAALSPISDYDSDYYGASTEFTSWKHGYQAGAVAAACGAFEFILFGLTTAIFFLRVLHYRKENATTPAKATPSSNEMQTGVEANTAYTHSPYPPAGETKHY
ncbi:MAG: hypothetical protein M1829_003834 [Trizodia sp. TS-e1964]|nr:MAG: hypothetical protein M1829_003834 [Trizodia sp. TS-e1964]